MEVAGACCHAGEERKVAVPIGNDAEVEPCVIAVDDSSVDRAIIAAILRSSRFRGALQAAGQAGGRAGGRSCGLGT